MAAGGERSGISTVAKALDNTGPRGSAKAVDQLAGARPSRRTLPVRWIDKPVKGQVRAN
jgi:hypothetical protein